MQASIRAWSWLVLVAACGGSSPGAVDAALVLDAPAPDSAGPDASDTSGCDYVEAVAATETNGVTPEASGLTVDGTAARVICGKLRATGEVVDTLDVDRFTITVAGAGVDLQVRFDSPGASAIDVAVVFVDDGDGGRANVAVNHGVTDTHLAAGTHEIRVFTVATVIPGAPIDYKLRLAPDTPALRCPEITAAATYAEASDGAQSTGNDTIFVQSSDPNRPGVELTTATDAPEATGIVAAAASSYRISGTSADVDVAPPNGDDYRDRDTFAFVTGAQTNEVELRLNWTGPADLDYLLFAGADLSLAGAGVVTNAGEAEFQTMAVKPGTSYRLWLGARDGSAGLPATYDVSLCGVSYPVN